MESSPQQRFTDLKTKRPKYNYDKTRKLGALISLELEIKVNKEKETPQVIVNQVRTSRGESSWTKK